MEELAERLRDLAVRRGVTFMDVRINEYENTAATRQDGKADKLSHAKTRGLGVRVLVDGAWGFATTNETTFSGGQECVEAALTMARASSVRATSLTDLAAVEPVTDTVTGRFTRDPRTVPLTRKMERLETLERAALDACGGRLANTIVSYSDSVVTETLCNTLGTLLTQETVRTSVRAFMTARAGDVQERYHEVKSARQGFELVEELDPADLSVRAAKTAVSLLSARRAPAGKFTVVFHPTVTAFLVHEAFGHNAEADAVVAGESILAGRVGEQVTADCLTIVDDATGPESSWGSYAYDSEGVPGQRRVIVERGILKGFLHSLQTAAAMGVLPNGSARAESCFHRPQVRMSNTFIEPGTMSLEALLGDIECGLLLKGALQGHVLPQRGQYTVHAGQGFWIRNGQIQEQVRDVSISGMTLETLLSADAVSEEWELAMPGTCGKGGQSMPVNGGGPYIRVREVVVGGQE